MSPIAMLTEYGRARLATTNNNNNAGDVLGKARRIERDFHGIRPSADDANDRPEISRPDHGVRGVISLFAGFGADRPTSRSSISAKAAELTVSASTARETARQGD